MLVVGHHCSAVAEEVACLAGVYTVLCVDNPCYEHQLAESVSALVHSLASPFDAILCAANTYGKNIMPRVAAYLDVTQVSDVSKIGYR